MEVYLHRCSNITGSESLKFKAGITGRAPADGNTKDVEIAVHLKYLYKFWSTLETPLNKCEANLILTWLESSGLTNSTGARKFKVIDTKLYIPVSYSINSRRYKTITTIKIKIQSNNQLD